MNMTFFYANARGLKSKKLSLIDILGEIKPDISLFTETMLKSQNEMKIEGYTFFGKSRGKKTCGGVGILVRNDLKGYVTPHETRDNIELLWVSLRRDKNHPIFLGVYYGKQESRNSRDEMLAEMNILSTEIQEKNNEGEVVLFMDGNGKIGLLGENISRNGALLENIFEECELEVVNRKEICKGKVTRQNRANESEQSAIDFVVASVGVANQIKKMIIDEDCEFVLKGSAMSDHNSIIVEMNVQRTKNTLKNKIIKWRLNAPTEKWENFDNALKQCANTCSKIMMTNANDFNQNYLKWKRTIEKHALHCIGKTTIKTNRTSYESSIVKNLRMEKQKAKKAFQNEKDYNEKFKLKDIYIETQNNLRTQLKQEQNENIERKITKMCEQGAIGFWKELKQIKRDEFSQWCCIKDGDGNRIFDSALQKEELAKYYENLYTFDEALEKHPYHDYVKQKIHDYSNDYNYDNEWYNRAPSRSTLEKIIISKKNKKATTDFPNEILKRGGEGFLKCLQPVIASFWKHETPPDEWNEGIISSVWKGKGDRENLKNHRGITVSSTISMVCEQVINERMMELIPLTQAQGGGKKGTSTRDHVFLLRGAITHALKNRNNMYITFYDVTKAYDRADVEDMLVTAWEKGLRGKLWRLMKNLNTNLTARIKTNDGLTRSIKRIAGGKQGGKNFGFLFAKMMDMMAEDAECDDGLGIKFSDLRMSVLEWVDDVVTFAAGEDQQNHTLQFVNNFAVKHKLKWGREKCNVKKIGHGRYIQEKWMLGQLEIDSCDQYKYLGDIVTRNGNNQKNIEDRQAKVMAMTRKILGLGGNEVFKNIQLKALLKMHNSCTVAALLTNSETWVLNQSEKTKIERIELWALKQILDVPITTPTAAIWYITGFLMTTILIDKRQMLYLKTILDRPNEDWTKKMFDSLCRDDIGWVKQIKQTLLNYGFKKTFDEIKSIPFRKWKNQVTKAADQKNKERLLEMCTGRNGEKKKTSKIAEKLKNDSYIRVPCMDIINRSRYRSKVQIMSMYSMLNCASNFKNGYKTIDCQLCHVPDDENHRINHCTRFKEINLYESSLKVDFDFINSDDSEAVDRIIDTVSMLWELRNGKNEMKSHAEN